MVVAAAAEAVVSRFMEAVKVPEDVDDTGEGEGATDKVIR